MRPYTNTAATKKFYAHDVGIGSVFTYILFPLDPKIFKLNVHIYYLALPVNNKTLEIQYFDYCLYT